MPTTQIRTRIDRTLKKKSDAVLKQLGLDTGSYVSMALTQLVHRRGLPFSVSEPDGAYFASEYALTPAWAAKAGASMRKETARSRRSGTLREITKPDDLVP
jgi:addiction module RelB/DinJ family antitoxin